MLRKIKIQVYMYVYICIIHTYNTQVCVCVCVCLCVCECVTSLLEEEIEVFLRLDGVRDPHSHCHAARSFVVA
jgi:hypothetical protein